MKLSELEAHQMAAVQRLRESIAELDVYDSVPSDDAFIEVNDDNTYSQLNDEAGAMFTLGHLRDLLSIFYSEN